MRVLLFTGKGGVGKTTAAAATAAVTARAGHKTLVLSTDPAHSLADALGVPLGGEPAEIEPGLYALQVDAQRRLEATWGRVQDWFADLLARGGLDGLRTAELSVLPGAEEVMALFELREQAASGRFDVVVVDCAPTAETLRLLALPEALRWYVDRFFPRHRLAVRAARPVLTRLGAGEGLPTDAVFEAVTGLHDGLTEVHALLSDPSTTTVRLVLTPESVVLAEARRTYSALALYGYAVDGVIANRVVPAGGRDPWRVAWRRQQKAVLAEVAESFAGIAIHRADYALAEPVGLDALAAFGADLYGDADPLAGSGAPVRPEVSADGEEYVLAVPLPLVDRADLDLARSGDELIVTVGAYRRLLSLPSGLRRCVVVGAALADGVLRVRFRPDPAVWPT